MRSTACVLICLAFCIPVTFSQTVVWQQEFQAAYNGEMLPFYSGGFDYAKPTLADIDNDGDLDLFVGHRYENGVCFFRNDGSASAPVWQLVTLNFFPLSVSYTKLAFCDIDGDGDLDGFMGEWSGHIHFFRNTGTTSAPSWQTYDVAFADICTKNGHSSPVFCDVDADGDYDMFLGTDYEAVMFYRNTGSASAWSFTLEDSSFAVGEQNRRTVPCFYDIDNDGDQDFFIGSDNNIWFYRNSGSAAAGVWTLESENYGGLPMFNIYCAPAFGDLDGDGDGDLIVGENEYAIRFYRNSGTPGTASWTEVSERYITLDVGYPCYPAFCDLDGDGDQDMLLGRYYYGVYLCENTGSPQAAAWRIDYTNYYIEDANTPAFCDIDGDGDKDLFLGRTDGSISFYENTGSVAGAIWSGSIGNYNNITTPDGHAHPAFCDIDDDGDYDLYVGTGEGELWFYENTGTAQAAVWADPDTSICNLDPAFMSRIEPAFADIDQDGDLDLFYGSTDGQIAFWRNEGTAAAPFFTKVTDAYNGIDGNYQISPVFVDIDTDGDVDLFVGHSNGGIMFWRNIGYTDVGPVQKLPETYTLAGYPNPFNPTTTLVFDLPRAQRVTLTVSNLLGKEVEVLGKGQFPAGTSRVVWDASQYPSGVYICRLQGEGISRMTKMVLMK